jgi:hypothetical protein
MLVQNPVASIAGLTGNWLPVGIRTHWPSRPSRMSDSTELATGGRLSGLRDDQLDWRHLRRNRLVVGIVVRIKGETSEKAALDRMGEPGSSAEPE